MINTPSVRSRATNTITQVQPLGMGTIIWCLECILVFSLLAGNSQVSHRYVEYIHASPTDLGGPMKFSSSIHIFLREMNQTHN